MSNKPNFKKKKKDFLDQWGELPNLTVNIKTKLWISFKQSKAQLQQTQLACTASTQH